MKPVHKFNNGNGATLCHNCNVIIGYGLANVFLCAECVEKLLELKKLTAELIQILETVEISDSENEFHPTVIRTCRVQENLRLNEIMPKISKIVKSDE